MFITWPARGLGGAMQYEHGLELDALLRSWQEKHEAAVPEFGAVVLLFTHALQYDSTQHWQSYATGHLGAAGKAVLVQREF